MAVVKPITASCPQEGLNRRSVLSKLPLAGAALAFPMTPDNESPLRALYVRWQAAKDEFAALPPDCGRETEGRIFNDLCRFEQQAADFDPQTMEDLIFKIIFADDNGDMNMNIHQSALVARAYAMAGLEQRNMTGA